MFPLISVFSNLSKKYNNIELNIIGNGSQKIDIIKKSKNNKNIKILNWKRNIKNYFSKSDLFVLNSFYEGLPNVLIDAVNYQIPCISTNVSGAKDILINGKGGYIIPVNDQYSLEKKIEYVINNYARAQKKIKYAKSNIKKFGKTNLLFFYKEFVNLIN